MMIKKYALPPYEIVEHSWRETSIYNANGVRLCLLDIEDYGTITEDNQEQFEEIVSLQAKLFSSAPDLLEALKMALPELKFSLQEGGHDPSVGIDASQLIAAIEYAEAAIAKATV